MFQVGRRPEAGRGPVEIGKREAPTESSVAKRTSRATNIVLGSARKTTESSTPVSVPDIGKERLQEGSTEKSRFTQISEKIKELANTLLHFVKSKFRPQSNVSSVAVAPQKESVVQKRLLDQQTDILKQKTHLSQLRKQLGEKQQKLKGLGRTTAENAQIIGFLDHEIKRIEEQIQGATIDLEASEKEQSDFLAKLCKLPKKQLTEGLIHTISTSLADSVMEQGKITPKKGKQQFESYWKTLEALPENTFVEDLKESFVKNVVEAPLKAIEGDHIPSTLLNMCECSQQIITEHSSYEISEEPPTKYTSVEISEGTNTKRTVIAVPEETKARVNACIDKISSSSFSTDHEIPEEGCGGHAIRRNEEGKLTIVYDTKDQDPQAIAAWSDRSPTSHMVQDTYGRVATVTLGEKAWEPGSTQTTGHGKIPYAFHMTKAVEDFFQKSDGFPKFSDNIEEQNKAVGTLVDQLMWRGIIGNLTATIFPALNGSYLNFSRVHKDLAPEEAEKIMGKQSQCTFQLLPGSPPQLQLTAVRLMKNMKTKLDAEGTLMEVPINIVKMTSTITIPATLPVSTTWREEVTTETLPLP
jgi:hypothetical protein